MKLQRNKLIGLAALAIFMIAALGTAGAQQPVVQVTNYQDTVRFEIQKAGTEAVQVDIFDLAGHPVYRSEWTEGDTLEWNLATHQGKRVANGVFLYVLKALNEQGSGEQWVGKLAVLEGVLQTGPPPELASGRDSDRPDSQDPDSVRAQLQTIDDDLQVNGTIWVDPASGDTSGAGRVHIEAGPSGDRARFIIQAHNPNNDGDKAVFTLRTDGGADPSQPDATFAVNDASTGDWHPAFMYKYLQDSFDFKGNQVDNVGQLVVRGSSGTNLIEAYNTGGGSAQGLVFRVERQTGDVYASSFNGGGADVAERIDVTEPVEAGDVVEIDPQHPGRFRKAQGRLSHRVAGVISTAPGLTLGNRPADGRLEQDTRPVLALAGRVPVKAIAKYGAIEVGDLLVSSPIPGYAMVCPEAGQCVGAVIGKALEPLEEGVGKIMIQVMLR